VHLNISELIELGSFVLAGLIYMKVKKKLILWLLIIIALVFVISLFSHDKANNSDTPKTDAKTSGNNSPAINQIASTTGSNSPITQTVVFGSPPPAPLDTKKDIRSFLSKIDPKILNMIDSGQTEIHVMLGVSSQTKLSNFAEREDFKKFLSFKSSGNVVFGSSNRIGDYINEANENGMMNSYILYPTDALKN
jgi:hypothetical protein